MNILLNKIPSEFVKPCVDELSPIGNVRLVVLKGDATKFRGSNNKIKVFSEKNISNQIYDYCSPWVLSEDEIVWAQRYEGLYLSMVNKFCINSDSSTSENLLKIYYEQFNFWLATLRENDINYCLSYFSPSEASSFCLHLAAKLADIPHIFRDNSVIANKFQNLCCSIESRNILMSYGKRDLKTFSWISKYMEKIRMEDSNTIPFYMDEVYDRYKSHNENIERNEIRKRRKRTVKRVLIKYLMITRRQPFYMYGKNISLRALERVSFLRINLERWRVMLSLELLKRQYKKLCSNPPKSKYIFLADSLIPENANTPQALHNRRVEFLIRYLHESLPKDVSIVYKVNPAQFMYLDHFWMGNRAILKNIQWFKDLTNIYNFKLMPESYSSQSLIKNSIGVACINGTVIIEALANNKRAITIAPTWLDGVYGIHNIKSVSDARQAIDLMLEDEFNREKLNLQDVLGDSGSIFAPKNINYLDFTLEDYLIINKAMKSAIKVYPLLSEDKCKV